VPARGWEAGGGTPEPLFPRTAVKEKADRGGRSPLPELSAATVPRRHHRRYQDGAARPPRHRPCRSPGLILPGVRRAPSALITVPSRRAHICIAWPMPHGRGRM